MKINYYHPPRSNIVIPYSKDNSLINQWMQFDDLIVQYKFNGTRALCYIQNNEIQFWNRHEERIDYQLPSFHKDRLLNIANNRNIVFDGELMHNKTKSIKNTYCIFDIFYIDKLLFGLSYFKRYSLLEDMIKNKSEKTIESNKIYLTGNWLKSDIDEIVERAKKFDWFEGVVLKRSGAISNLRPLTKDTNNGSFMARIRKPNKNYLS